MVKGSCSNMMCKVGWDKFRCKCYKSLDKKKWQRLFDHCQDVYQASMVVIESEDENEFIVETYSRKVDHHYIYLGCKSETGSSTWHCPGTGAEWSSPNNYSRDSYWSK
nr:perlucin-like protein [Lytechinus pictus]